MRKKILMTILLFVMPFLMYAGGKIKNKFNWNGVMDAIVYVESKGVCNITSGKCCGPMQIQPCLVAEVNNIVGKKKYTLKDRFNLQKSKEMFVIFQNNYNPTNNIEKAIRMWNGGLHYSISKTNKYYRKVMSIYQKNRKK